MIVIFIVAGIIGCVCCCYCVKKHMHASQGTAVPVVALRTYDVTPANQPRQTVVKMVPLNQPPSSDFPSAPPPYSEVINTNVPDVPQYCEAEV